jgi:potassium-dependent mechanosensitive channel
MALHRKLSLLLLAILLSAFHSAIGLNGTRCLAQNGVPYPTYSNLGTPQATGTPNARGLNYSPYDNGAPPANAFPPSPWMPSHRGFADPNPSSGQVPNFVATYGPMQIDAARRTANQVRTKLVPNLPIITELVDTNARLVEQWVELAEKINAVSVRGFDANAKLDSVTRDYEDVGAKLRQHGLTPTIGLLLSHKRSQLEDWQIDGSAGHALNTEIQRSRSKQMENEMVAPNGSDVPKQSNEILASAGYGPTHIEHAALASQVQSLLRERSDWLRMLSQGYNDYRQRLGELDSACTAFDKLIRDYRNLIHRHVTWIRSSDPLGIADVRKFRTGIGSLFDARRFEAFGYSIMQKWSINPVSGVALLGSIFFILVLRIVAKIWLIGIGRRKRMSEATVSARKCVASLLTPLMALAIPSVLYLIARWLGTEFVTESTLHASSGLYAASLVALIVEVPRHLLCSNGFVEKHIPIELPRQQRAMAYLQVIGIVLVLSAYTVTLAENIDHGVWGGSIGRLGFIASLLLVAWTAHLALKPTGGFLEPIVERFGGMVLHRIRLFFYLLGIGFPLAMIALSSLGYAFTATEIVKRAGLMFVSVLIAATLWSAVKILCSSAWHTLTGTRDERRFDPFGELPTARVTGALAEKSLEVKHQIAFLGQCGLVLAAIVCAGWLWIDILPNVNFGNPVAWTVQQTVTKTVLEANGQKVNRSEVETTSITMLHLILAGATLFTAFQLSKLLPAIFDALVLQRVNFDEAMEHLSLVLGRCVLFGAGCFVACRLVGLRWETIQWLAVGLAIGLGFALQDIMRNLFGGLVVLFEKPARLGDLITVGNVTGRVAAQKLRTTVLTDEGGREIIVPNQNFVNLDVVNWMGAGRLQAIPIEVAVTRDERPADVCRMLQQFLVGQTELLLNPAPQATLVCVSQQSQRIELRAWIEDGQDATRYRDHLAKLVLHFLAEKNLLAPYQPTQPSLNESTVPNDIGARSTRSKRSA